ARRVVRVGEGVACGPGDPDHRPLAAGVVVQDAVASAYPPEVLLRQRVLHPRPARPPVLHEIIEAVVRRFFLEQPVHVVPQHPGKRAVPMSEAVLARSIPAMSSVFRTATRASSWEPGVVACFRSRAAPRRWWASSSGWMKSRYRRSVSASPRSAHRRMKLSLTS